MNKKRVKLITSVILLIIVLLLIIKSYNYYRIKNAKIEITLVSDLTLKFREKKKVSDYIKKINGKIVNDYTIDSTKIGKKNVKFEFINDDNIKVKYEYQIKVVDITPPVVWLNNSYNVAVNSDISFVDNILCGDDSDPNPVCQIDGEFDLNTTGIYPVKFKATDKSGNLTEVEFNLRVYEPVKSNNIKSEVTKTYFSDVVNNYKTDKTKIGIDVSGWQKEIDFEKIKAAGVEFIIIKVGGTKGTNKDYYVDSQFKRNIEMANKYNIPVGLYFYSYASNSKEAVNDAKWLLKQIKGYKVTLPIAFDWEDFSDFNNYNISFYELTHMAESFLNTLENEGYKGMVYSSKSYLERIWLDYKYDTWLAHYVDKTSYVGDYKFWQICDDGIIDGIDGAVDIDIMYN
ncbi:MAG: hypothetical protein E7158_04525 [Firmicutes bacterium]|nr:hypothetical protein [Bacillota bacterium]